MKKRSILILAAFSAAALFFAVNVNAQTTAANPWRFDIGLEGGAPTGYETTYTSFEFGGTARLQYNVSGGFALTLTSGFYNFFGKTFRYLTPNGAFTGTPQNFGVVPVKAGMKIFLAPTLYVGGEAGAGFETISGGNTKLILSPALGYAVKAWDISARYENFSGQAYTSFGLLGLRVAYVFPL